MLFTRVGLFHLIHGMLTLKCQCSAIDNTSIQCLHGKVQMSKVTSMKRLSSKAWDTLLSKVNLFSCYDSLCDGLPDEFC